MDTVVETKDFDLKSLAEGQEFWLFGKDGWRLRLRKHYGWLAAECLADEVFYSVEGQEFTTQKGTTVSMIGPTHGGFRPAVDSAKRPLMEINLLNDGVIREGSPLWVRFESELDMQVLGPIKQVMVAQF
jgi:hypothetical protein